MSGTVLITRPVEAARPLQDELARRGWKSLAEPVITIEPLPAALPDLRDYHGLIFTSANGVRAFASLSGKRDIPVYTVGKVTAAAVREVVFDNVYEGPGDLESLSARLQEMPQLEGQKLLHLSGDHTAGSPYIPGAVIENLIIYRAVAAEHLSPACLEGLDSKAFNAALFYSPRTAKIFTGLLRQYARTDAAASIKALCIADSVVKSLEGATWKDVQVAPRPDAESLLGLL